MATSPADSAILIERAHTGDREALNTLLDRYRLRLRRMVEMRLDTRLQARIDASDVIQEAYLEVAGRLDEYLRDPKLPPFLWLRLIVGERLARLHRHHLGARMRDAGQEVSLFHRCSLPAARPSSGAAAQLLGRHTSPTQAALRAERILRLQEALNTLEPIDREILSLRHFEELTAAETAGVLGIEEPAAASRHFRALKRSRRSWPRCPAGRRVFDMVTDDSQRFVLLDRLGEEYAERYRRGERPALEEYIDRYPELADEIREYFPAMVDLEQVKQACAEAQPPDRGPLPSLERLGDYRILRQIGHGGMGVVYEAEQVSLRRHVALKVLPLQLLVDPRTKQRFEREARSAARLHHTNIVPVFGVGEHEGLPYFVMQFIQGLGLDEVLEEPEAATIRVRRQWSRPASQRRRPPGLAQGRRLGRRPPGRHRGRHGAFVVDRPVRDRGGSRSDRCRVARRDGDAGPGAPGRIPAQAPSPAAGRLSDSLLADVRLIGHAPGDRLRIPRG